MKNNQTTTPSFSNFAFLSDSQKGGNSYESRDKINGVSRENINGAI